MDVDEKGAAGQDVGGALAGAREPPRRAPAAGGGADGAHRSDGGRAGEDPSRGRDDGVAGLAADGQLTVAATRQNSDLDRL